MSTYQALISSAESNNCEEVRRQLQDYAFSKDRGDHDVEDDRMLKELKRLDSIARINFVGLEFSDREVSEGKKAMENLERIYERAHTLCPKMEDLWARANLRAWGPEYEFARRMKGRVSLAGVDSEEFRKQSFEPFSVIQNFDYTESYPPEAVNLIENLDAKVRFGLEEITETEIAKLVATVEDREKKLRLENLGRALQRIVVLARKRNNFIVNYIRSHPANYAIVIGNAHVPGLYEEFRRSCAKWSQ